MTLDEVVPHPQYRMCHSRTISPVPSAPRPRPCGMNREVLRVVAHRAESPRVGWSQAQAGRFPGLDICPARPHPESRGMGGMNYGVGNRPDRPGWRRVLNIVAAASVPPLSRLQRHWAAPRGHVHLLASPVPPLRRWQPAGAARRAVGPGR